MGVDDARAVLAAHDLDRNGVLDYAEFKAFLTANAGSIQARAGAHQLPAGSQPVSTRASAAPASNPRTAPRCPGRTAPQEAVLRRLPGGGELEELEGGLGGGGSSSGRPPPGSSWRTGSDDAAQDA